MPWASTKKHLTKPYCLGQKAKYTLQNIAAQSSGIKSIIMNHESEMPMKYEFLLGQVFFIPLSGKLRRARN